MENYYTTFKIKTKERIKKNMRENTIMSKILKNAK